MKLCKCLPMDRKKIVFKSFRGIECGDNPRAIFDALYAKRPDLHYVWVVANDAAATSLQDAEQGAGDEKAVSDKKTSGNKKTDSSKKTDGRIKIVRHGSLAEIKELATAKIWVDNKRKGCWTSKRKGQFYLQTWHGGIALKKIEKDAEDKLPAYYIKSAKRDSKLADAFVSGSGWQTKNYRDAFWYEGEMWEIGLPRNDLYFRQMEQTASFEKNDSDSAALNKKPETVREKVWKAFNLSENDSVILYAPTFREDYSMDAYDLDCERLIRACRKRFGGTWKVIMKLHPNVADREDYFRYSDVILKGSHYGKMNELIAACDLLITDYSSCMFDSAEGGKRVFLYASDRSAYLADRGFYFSFEELPFTLAQTNEELEKNIELFNEDDYAAKTEAFFKSLKIYDNAHAADTAAGRLLQIMGSAE